MNKKTNKNKLIQKMKNNKMKMNKFKKTILNMNQI